MWGVRGRALSHPRPLVRSGVRPGPTTHWLWVRGVRAWGPVTSPTSRALARWLCALWGRHEGARGGAFYLGVGRPETGALPPPTTRPFGPAAGAHYPLAVNAGGAGVGTRHQPHSARSCELALRAVGAAQGRPGGAPLAWVWGVRGRALSHPRPLVRLGVRPGPTTHWLWVRGVRACGPVTNPTARALASWLWALWGGMRVPGGSASCLGVERPGTGALQPPISRPLGRAAGAHPLPTGCGCGGCQCGDPSPTPQRALLRAGFARCGGGMSVPGGGASCLGVGRPGTGALPPPTSRPFGRAAGAHYPLVVGAGGAGVGTRHQPHSARSCVLCGRHEGARGGRLLPGCGASGVGRFPTPDHSSFRACGRGPLPTGCGCGGCGRGDSSPTAQRALLRAGFARCGGGTRAPGEGASCLGVGRPGTGALPPPTSRPFGRAAGAHYPLAVGAGGAGMGTRHQPNSARSCELALRALGAA